MAIARSSGATRPISRCWILDPANVDALDCYLHDAIDSEKNGETMSPFDEALHHAHAGARAAWPQIDVSFEEFRGFVGERLASDGDASDALPSLRIKELFLTCACARGDQAAIRLLEAHYFPMLLAALGRMRLTPSKTQEICQVLREQLFVRVGGQPLRIAHYAGRGDLGSWLSVSAVRAAYKLIRKEKREISDDDEHLAALSGATPDVELSYVKQRCRSVFRECFGEAMAALGTREKNLLRQHYIDGLTLDQVGALYQTHRATAARWLAAARAELLARTREALQRRLGAPMTDCESVIRMAQSQMEMTFNNLLGGE
jgi:RNA polymerase sigma-70 factor (ECF subfamily)